MQLTSLEEKYFQLLTEYIADPSEEYLMQAADLGRELVQADYLLKKSSSFRKARWTALPGNLPIHRWRHPDKPCLDH